MKQTIRIRVLPEVAGQMPELLTYVSDFLKVDPERIRHIDIIQRSIDARQRQVYINLNAEVYVDEEFVGTPTSLPDFPNVEKAEEVLVIGSGPAGLFAALQLILLGKRPIVLERGKSVKDRPADLRQINVYHNVNEDSNYCFGEGGAGTYSDGKLYTRSKKRGNIRQILEWLVGFGANPNILVEAHPHIGTNKLPPIIQKIRETIIDRGGEVHFQKRITDFLMDGNSIRGVKTSDGSIYKSKNVILATGHSARDIFELLERKEIEIEAKPIAVGVRVEHSQNLIDSIQYHCSLETGRGNFLPPSSYSIVKQVKGRGVHSFCMCPGGVIAPCATSPGEVVTNGWSSSERARATANSGIVVQLELSDYKQFDSCGQLAGVAFQSQIERKAWEAGGKTQVVPAQRLIDFVNGKLSSDLPKTSYPPGIQSVQLSEVLPGFITEILRQGFREFGKSMKGYLTNEAVVHAPETRTSSPVQIPRDSETLEHIRVRGLYPCGEGAGYAGGIISAAMDGIRVATALVSGKVQ